MMNDIEMIDQAYILLHEEKVNYMGNRFKRWIALSCGVLLGAMLAQPVTSIISSFSTAVYNRKGIDVFLKTHFGDRTYDDIAVDELMINAYAFNAQEPRFYSKYFRRV